MSWLLVSRRRVFLLALALLLVLDLGRSLYARVAYRLPAETWDGRPYDLAMKVWPPARNVPPGAPLGQRVYIENCAVCHGTEGNGKGISAPSIYPRPRDFTTGQFKYKTTGPGQPPSDEDLMRVVREGLPASPMPYFRDFLSDEEIRAVVAYVKGLSAVSRDPSPQTTPIPPRTAPDAESLARGRQLFAAQCASCHGAEGRTRSAMQDAQGFTVHTRDLTAPWTFRGGSEPEQLWLRVTNGLAPSPMPSFADTLTPAQRWDVVNYVLSLARSAPWELGGKLEGPRSEADPLKRGEYLVHATICGLCHTQVNPTGIYRGDDRYLAGGMLVRGYPYGLAVSRNLTGDPETGLGNKPVDEIVSIIRTGRASDRVLNFFFMPWMVFHHLNEDDARAMATYLKTVPPVPSRIPPPVSYGFVETVAMKLVTPSLPVPVPTVLTYAEGTRGDPNPGVLRADWPARTLISTQWAVLLAGLALFAMAGPRETRLPRRLSGWLALIGASLGLLLLGLISWAIYGLPALLPLEPIVQATSSGLRRPEAGQFESAERYALAERGYYIFTSISCSFCHGPDGSGGAKVNGQGLGTVWTRNISSDPATGIGGWSDGEIARAIRGGITKGGRPLYWQGMPWDHFANLDEEDVRSVVAYLRTLPPVSRQVPLPAPPGPDDCPVYTFWLQPDNFEPGCK